MPIDCVVINLDSQPQRLARMEKRLAVLDCSWRRFSAITPDRVTRSFAEQCAPEMQACAQSHYEVWLEIQKTNAPYTLICEDDVMFRKDAAAILLRALRDIPKRDPEWHALFLNHSAALNPKETWRPITHNTARGVELLLTRFVSGLLIADAMTGWWLQPLGHSYGYFPWLAIQEHLNSSIQTPAHCDKDRRIRDHLLATTSCTVFDYF